MSVRVETERAERLRRDRIEQSKRQWTAGDDSMTCLTNSNYGMQCDDSTSQESTSSTLKVMFLPLQRTLQFFTSTMQPCK